MVIQCFPPRKEEREMALTSLASVVVLSFDSNNFIEIDHAQATLSRNHHRTIVSGKTFDLISSGRILALNI
jgi:hypothetical protein